MNKIKSAWKAHKEKKCTGYCYYCKDEKDTPKPTKKWIKGGPKQ